MTPGIDPTRLIRGRRIHSGINLTLLSQDHVGELVLIMYPQPSCHLLLRMSLRH